MITDRPIPVMFAQTHRMTISDTTLELTDVQKKSTFSGIGQINSLVISSSLRWNSNSKNEIQKVWTN
ncbi:MAG: hypothetical protein M3O68_09450 [Thermoproteota archaeon]|jgi:hypothetical protein|nr:hypothetical protein [Thermoproteota archaeon]